MYNLPILGPMTRLEAIQEFARLQAALNWELATARYGTPAEAAASNLRVLDILDATLELRDAFPDVRLSEVPARAG